MVTDITVDDIEIRIHGKAHGGTGSTALYRIANVADIYAHVEEKCKEAKGAIADCVLAPRARQPMQRSSFGYPAEGLGGRGHCSGIRSDSREGINMKVKESIYDKQFKTLRKGEWFEPTGFDHDGESCAVSLPRPPTC